MTNDILERDDAFYQKMADEFNAKDPKELNSEGVISLAEAVLSEQGTGTEGGAAALCH